MHGPERLAEVAAELNGRPRKTLGGLTPAAAPEQLLSDPDHPPVAPTPETRIGYWTPVRVLV